MTSLKNPGLKSGNNLVIDKNMLLLVAKQLNKGRILHNYLEYQLDKDKQEHAPMDDT